MADKAPTELLQPALIDRLSDDEPNKTVEPREARVIDARQLLEIVRRDLTWLLNTDNIETLIEDDTEYPNVLNSVINYGIQEVAGEVSTRDRAMTIRKLIAQSVERFEPRVRPGSLVVDFEDDANTNSTHISYSIRAEIMAKPMPLELYLRSRVNVMTGELELERKG